jgi:CoA:oxalate CoA-transferase
MDAALDGIRVLDLTRVLAGPYATMILADLGAEVIKVELPGKGDDSRAYPPFIRGESAYFMSLNRNKRSLALNVKSAAGRQILLELVEKSDVLVENFRPGTMEKLGLGYESLKAVNPRLIYAAISGFGQSGPYRDRPAYDAVVQAMGGIMSITGQTDGIPTRVGASIGDITAGLFGAVGILAALIQRERSGVGQMVDVAMLDCQVAILENAIARYLVGGEIPKPQGNRHPSIVPFESFETADGYLVVAAGNDELWRRLCEALGLKALADDPRFLTNELRNQHYEELRPLLAERMKTQTTDAWRAVLDRAGVPNGPINTVVQVVQDAQVLARRMLVEVQHPTAGAVKMAGVPIKLSETPGEVRSAPPLLGQHSEEILSELLGYSREQIACLRHQGVIG